MSYLSQREVSLGLQLRLLFGSVIALIGWFFLPFGMLFVYIFAFNADVSFLYLDSSSPQAEGKVLKVVQTNARENKKTIYAYHFEFMYEANKRAEGVSYGFDRNLNVGNKVTIVYNKNKPSYAKIVNMRKAMFGVGILFVCIFPIIGIILIFLSFVKGMKDIHLLRTGTLGYGKLIGKTPTNARINNKTVYKLIFELEVNGQKYEVSAQSHKPEYLTDEPQETLFYDANNPKNAILKDALPARVHLINQNQLEPVSVLSSLHYLILPILGVLALLLIFV